MCIKAVEVDPSFLELIPDHFKAQGICDKAVKEDSFYLSLIGLLQGSGCGCGMITIMMMLVIIGMMIMMKINFLSGTMVIKNERLKKPQ